MDVESALLGNPTLHLHCRLFVGGEFLAELALRPFHECDRPIGTGRHACPRAATGILIDEYDAILPFSYSAGRAGFQARRVFAVAAQSRQEHPFDRRIRSHFLLIDGRPPHPRSRTVLLLTGDRTGVTANTSGQINHHSPAFHYALLPLADLTFRTFTLTQASNAQETVSSLSTS